MCPLIAVRDRGERKLGPGLAIWTILVVNSGVMRRGRVRGVPGGWSGAGRAGAGPVGVQPEEVERAGHVHVVQAGFRQAAVAGTARAMAGGLVHGAFHAGAAGVVRLERDRLLCGSFSRRLITSLPPAMIRV